jgi:hydroxymethylpyrimidine pyrophosphatase-like HAD family hydrolase
VEKGVRFPGGGLFIADLDGTLLGSGGTVASRDLAALAHLGEIGVTRAVATGRSLHSFRNAVGSTLPIDYVIFTTGAGIARHRDDGLLFTRTLGREEVLRAVDFLERHRLDFMVHDSIPHNHRYRYRLYGDGIADARRRIAAGGAFARPLPEEWRPRGESAQLLSIVDGPEGGAMVAAAREELPGLSVIRATSPLDGRSTWIEIFPPGVSKSHGAAWLAETLSIPREAVAMVGNDYNDADLLEWAGRGFAVANAPDELKIRFENVPSCDSGGTARAIERWLN